MNYVKLDINAPRFQTDWFALPTEDGTRLTATLRKISRMTWAQLYADRGLRWEAIESVTSPAGGRLYSLRITQKARAVAYRDGEFLRLVSLHPDHDSAYS